MGKTRVGIINVTGYAGVELARILFRHPEIELVSVTGRSAAGQKLGDFFPHLFGSPLTITAELVDVDIAFSAMPQKESAAVAIPLVKNGIKVIDISADFRLKDASLYPSWYGFTHPAPDLLEEAVFGLPELHRAKIKSARIIANPGCYPTSAILALAPAIKAGLIEPDVILESKSGVSGAGRTLSLGTHYSEVNEDVSAYSLSGHRHLPEIAQELSLLHRGPPVLVTFIPHLIPMTRGILSTCYARLVAGKLPAGKDGEEALKQLYCDFYKNEPFVRIADASPHTKHTYGSNLCIIYPIIDHRTGRLISISVIDNLVKGAAGQAIQNMNIMLGLPETMSLEALGVYP
ncbi:MAG: N-acetyl-gamma-glutamyl-phosphate reductase [Chloroflexi bacterium]|nr:N-acetyl-gamma-glutamyl-phosphate reductase [Chloroflexota bacterium]